MTTPRPVHIALLTSIALLGGCENKATPSAEAPAATTNAPAAPQPQAAAPLPATSLPEGARQQVERVLPLYETIRAELARDDITAATRSAEPLERAAQEAASSAPEALRAKLTQLASAAARFKEMPAKDAAEARRAFGQVSQALVALLAAEPSLQKGRYVFECPMAQGYKKWVQATDKISNPYMGTRMLECGSPSKWQDG